MWFLILINIIVWFGLIGWIEWKSNFLKGKGGEWFVSRKLEELDSKYYKVINDVMLPSKGNTGTTQIDHIVVSNYGLFCIETKAYRGRIYGNTHNKNWYQYLAGKKYEFYNPLFQNYAHIKSLEDLIKPIFPNVTILGFVIMPNAYKLKISGNESSKVGYARDIIKKIKEINLQLFSDDDVTQILELLRNANIVDKKIRKEHELKTVALKKGGIR